MNERVVWAPLPGGQQAFLSCPVYEVLFEGTRGPGKTDALLMDFAQHCGQGFGADWRGVIFRQSYPQLTDIIAKSKKWFSQIWPQAKFNETKTTWTWPGGEQLLLRQFDKPDDYWNFHGHAYPYVGWEELTTWPNDNGYKLMMSCCRSTNPRMPRKYRATTNPYGSGHNWVKTRFRLPGYRFKIINDSVDAEGRLEPPRVAIHGTIFENKVLLDADPGYIQRLRAAARNPSELKAWMEGSWDIVAGGMFDDVWSSETHVIEAFPSSMIPDSWRIDRSFDWGASRPFSVGWWLESNGEPLKLPSGRLIGNVRGDLIRYAEWYGYSGKRNEGLNLVPTAIAEGILDREERMGLLGKVKAGPADTSIFDEAGAKSIASQMQKIGVRFEKADKGPGSRRQGWQQMRERMGAALAQPQEKPGLFVVQTCQQFLETVPVLPRDDKDLDDVDTEAEDHIADETRYRVRRMNRTPMRRAF